MERRYNYICPNCHGIDRRVAEETNAATFMQPVACGCGAGQLQYAGYEDEDDDFNVSRYVWVGEPESYHYFQNQNDGGLYWYDIDSQQWVARGMAAQAEPFEPDQVVADAVAVAQTYPASDQTVMQCQATLASVGLRQARQQAMAMQMIDSELISNGHAGALAMLRQWNTAFADHPIALEETGIRLDRAADEADAAVAEVAPVVVQQITHVTRSGVDFPVAMFSNAGGFHQLFTVTGPNNIVVGERNDRVLVRLPRPDSGAPTPQAGAELGRYWRDHGFRLPFIHNYTTLAADGFYVVERVDHEFDPNDPRHLRQVADVFTQMARSGEGPDFRPANVRFRGNGETVLIDFSENPGSSDDPDQFPATLDDFVGQFANGNNTVRNQLCSGISREMRERMRNALQPWHQ